MGELLARLVHLRQVHPLKKPLLLLLNQRSLLDYETREAFLSEEVLRYAL